METKELYVVGDKSRLVVKTLLRDLEKKEIVTHVIEAGVSRVQHLPEKDVHVVLCLNDNMSMEVVDYLYGRVTKQGMHLYLVGKINGLELEDEEKIKKMQVPKFPTWPVSVKDLLIAVDQNARYKKRILVVDDEPMMLRSIQEWLDEDFEVSLVNSGKTALEFLTQHAVDLILLDYEMPEMSGVEVLTQLRGNPLTEIIPVMFLTSKDDKASVTNAITLHPDGYLLKSRSPDEIRTTIREFLWSR